MYVLDISKLIWNTEVFGRTTAKTMRAPRMVKTTTMHHLRRSMISRRMKQLNISSSSKSLHNKTQSFTSTYKRTTGSCSTSMFRTTRMKTKTWVRMLWTMMMKR